MKKDDVVTLLNFSAIIVIWIAVLATNGCAPKQVKLGQPELVQRPGVTYTKAKIGELYHVLASDNQSAMAAQSDICADNYCQVAPQGSYYVIQVTPRQ